MGKMGEEGQKVKRRKGGRVEGKKRNSPLCTREFITMLS